LDACDLHIVLNPSVFISNNSATVKEVFSFYSPLSFRQHIWFINSSFCLRFLLDVVSLFCIMLKIFSNVWCHQ
jgi:hypothetical protein